VNADVIGIPNEQSGFGLAVDIKTIAIDEELLQAEHSVNHTDLYSHMPPLTHSSFAAIVAH